VVPRTRRTLVALAAVATLTASGCSLAEPSADSSNPSEEVSAVAVAAAPKVTTVVAISVDGLNPAAIGTLGESRTPTLHRLIAEGAASLNARTEYEQTNTLPNHTGMVTSRRVDARHGGHGVTWNDDRKEPATVQAAAGHPVASVFSVVHAAGKKTAVFASKTKFSLFERSWPDGIDKYVELGNNVTLAQKVVADVENTRRAFRFVHLSAPDGAGHAHGFMSPEYLDAVAATDKRIGWIIDAIEADSKLAGHTVVIVTADHGGRGASHRDPTKWDNYRIPFIVWGTGVKAGASLYGLNKDYRNPHRARPTYAAAKQPVRNGDVANLATDLLGLPRVKGSELNAAKDLDVN